MANEMQKTGGNAPATTQSRGQMLTVKEVQDAFKKAEAGIQAVVPNKADGARLVRLACGHIAVASRTNDILLKCTVESLVLCLMESARLGLPLGGPLARAHPVPYWNTKINGYEAKMILDFKGYVELALRSGRVTKIEAHVVFEADEFQMTLGDQPTLYHQPKIIGDRGERVGAYAIAWFPNGAIVREFVPECDLQSIKRRATAKQKGESGPWYTDEEQMCRKTAVRRLQKYLPLTEMPELMAAIQGELEQEDALDLGIAERVPQALLPPANRAAGHKAATQRRAQAESQAPVDEQAPTVSNPAVSPQGANSGQPDEQAVDGQMFPDPVDDNAPPADRKLVPLEGGEAFRANFRPKDNPHIAEKARAKWASEFNAEADK